MRRNPIQFISQKIKELCVQIRRLAEKIGILSRYRANSDDKCISAERGGQIKLPIDGVTAKYALEYIFSIVSASAYEKGAGIIVEDINSLREMNTFSSLVCSSFRYITIYTKNMDSANEFADYVYERYGLPIMVMSVDEAARCRYPVIIDLIIGKIRYGRDVCIDGAVFDSGNNLLGISAGSRIIKSVDNSLCIKYN